MNLFTRTSRAIACIGIIASASRMQAQPRLHTVAEWRGDLAFLLSTMKAVHPSPFHRVSEADMDRAAASLHADIPRLGDQQIALRLAAIVALLNDGHCRLQLAPPVFTREASYPVRIERFRDGIFVVATRPEDQAVRNRRVISVNGRAADIVWDSVMVLASGDNVFSRMTDVPPFLSMPEVMAGLGLARPDSLVLDLASEDGRTLRYAIPAVKGKFDPGAFGGGWNGPGGAVATPPGSASLVERHRQSPYWFAVEGRLLYAQINQVANSRDTVQLGTTSGVASLNQLAQRIIERADAGDIDKVVIDLRFNGGGDNSLARPFVQQVSAAKINQKGRLFVVTGRHTYSAAMNFTSMFEERTAAVFVGEPPGGAPSHYGDNTPFVLPASKLPLRISTLHWDIGVRPSDVREVMETDLPAPPTFADYRTGTDAPLKAIASYRDGDRLADRLLARYTAAGLDSAIALYDRERATRAGADIWSSDEQQLVSFGYGVLSQAQQRAEIFRVFAFVTERYPDAPDAWTTQARIHAFVNDTPEVLRAFARARQLRPQNDFIRRSYEAAVRKQ